MSDPAAPAAEAGSATASAAAAQPDPAAGAPAETAPPAPEPETPVTEAPVAPDANLSEAQIDAIVAKLVPHAQAAAKAEVADLADDLNDRIDSLAKFVESSAPTAVHAALGRVTAELAVLQGKLKHWL